MDKKNTVGIKSLAFAIRIVQCYKYLKFKWHDSILSAQLLRSGTSIGANIRESVNAQSRRDFISKLCIALKEAGETDYWLDVIYAAGYFTKREYISLKTDNEELIRLLSAIIKKTKYNAKTES